MADDTSTIENFLFVATPGTSFVGAAAVDGARAGDLIPVLSDPVFAEPGTFGSMAQPSLFGRGVGGRRTIELNISGQELGNILSTASLGAVVVGGLSMSAFLTLLTVPPLCVRIPKPQKDLTGTPAQ